jgi:tRNA pseudouridine38-40 synthase
MRYFIELAYQGTNYCGWQKQANAPTVQETLNDRLSTLFRHEIDVVGAGRTDTGVHAMQYYAHFDTVKPIEDCRNAVYRLNKMLPEDISIFDIFPVSETAHARYNATSRTYHYLIETAKNPFTQNLVSFRRQEPDIELMNQAARYLLEVTDFKSFCKVGSDNKTTICDVKEAIWYKKNEHRLVFKITADRFLRNMVRAIVGTLLEVGEKKTSIEEFISIVQKQDRSSAGDSVEPQGLYLTGISYPFVKEKTVFTLNIFDL